MQDFEDLDYYELLGVERNATAEEIKRAYRQQILRYHPDRFVTGSPAEQEYARQRTLRINEAYGTLSDFAARSAYNRGGAAQRTVVQAPPKPQAAPPPRDHQAELYNQGRAHIEAGRYVQALALLRQLQQVNPFYRDTTALVAMVEAQLQPEPAPHPPQASEPAPTSGDQEASQRTRRWVLGGAIGGAAMAAVVAAVVGLRGQASRLWSGTPTEQAEAATPMATEAVVAAGPTSAPIATATSAPSPSPLPSATAEPTQQPSATAEPTLEPTTAPSATAVPPTPVEEQGTVLLADSFSRGGWPTLDGTGWSVGYVQGGRYRIVANPGSGNIWSYRTLGTSNYSLGVDVTADSGSAGLLVRYQDRANYVVCMITPSEGGYRVEQRSAGRAIIIDQGASDAIDTTPGAANRIVVRVEGNGLTMRVNDTTVVETTVRGIPQTRQYGMVAASGVALFDNIEARE